ncbi:uncharacterized protein [Narcine bancroftii]|uniref:uncharacterized protein n=1 Tax=Narcine bancroftii TaxID=1343680 RepID=UPI0038316110
MKKTILVSNLPTGVPKRSLEDKLTIHFLRAKNGGGEVIDVVFPNQLLSSAYIIFDEEEVAQRVLQVENHILEINGKQYKLKVKSVNTEIKVDEVIPHISVTIDYGKLFGGKLLMQHFQKTHKGVQFTFDQKAERCIVDGRFSDIKEITGEIHHTLSLKADQSTTNSDETKDQLCDGQERTAFKTSNSIRQDSWKSNADCHAKADDLELQKSVRGTDKRGTDLQQTKLYTSPIENCTLLMDYDIYLYIQTFCKDRYQSILHKNLVEVLDITEDSITMLYLQAASGCLDKGTSLQQAHHELSQLYQSFQSILRKEQVMKQSITSDEKLLQEICVSLQAQFSQIIFNEDVDCFYLIGTSHDCSLAKKHLQDLKEELCVRSQGEMHVTPGSFPEDYSASSSSIPHSLRELKDRSSFKRGESPKTDVRKDHKLAPTFNGKREVDNAFMMGSRVAKDNLDLKPDQTANQLMTGSSKAKGLLMDTKSWEMQQVPHHSTTTTQICTNADKAATTGTGQLVTPTDFSLLTNQAKLLKSPDKTASDILFKGDEDSSSLCPNNDQHNKALGPVKPCHFETSAGTLFHLGDTVVDTTQTNQSRRSSKASLRKTNSFSGRLKSKRSLEAANNFQEKPSEVDLTERVPVTEELLIDSVVWSYVKDIHDLSIRQIRIRTEVTFNEQLLGDTIALKLTARNWDNVIAAKEDILSLYTLVMKHLTQQFLSYEDLGIVASPEKNMEQFRCSLKNKFPKVKFFASKAGFYIIGTYEYCLKVIETFKPELKYTFLEDMSRMGPASISASNQHPLLDTEKLKDTEGEKCTRSADLTSLGRAPLARKPEDSKTLDSHMDCVILKTPAKREEPPLFQLEKEFTESMGHWKASESSKLCNSLPDGEEQSWNQQIQYPNERDSPVLNLRQEHSPFMDQKRSPKTLEEVSGLELLQDQGDYKCQRAIKQIGDVEGVKTRKTLPDRFNLTSNRLTKESHWCNKESPSLRNRVEGGTQSLPIFPSTDMSALSSHQRKNGQYITESTPASKGQMQAKYIQQPTERNEIEAQESKSARNSLQSHYRSPAIGMDAKELSECCNCGKGGKLSKEDCGQALCKECRAVNQEVCLACGPETTLTKNKSPCAPTMSCAVLNIGLSGFLKDMTLQITYDIPDGSQKEDDPNPGEPYKGGQFKAYLPDSIDGRKVLLLLQKAFKRGLIFKVQSLPSKPAQVTWNEIPHKTATTGGKLKNGYPDPGYFRKVLSVLEKYGLR